MANKTDEHNITQILTDFCALLEKVPDEYQWNYDEVHRLDLLTQDYLHKLELEELSYAERAKIATALAKTRKSRRRCKDTASLLEPLAEFIRSQSGKILFNMTREVLGKTRKAEKLQENRAYIPRVLEPEKKGEAE